MRDRDGEQREVKGWKGPEEGEEESEKTLMTLLLKEMLEEKDYIRIQYQDELRNKKPAGIHWLQAASTAIFTGPEAKQIWTYRVPSWLGAAFGTLACFWAGLPLIGRRASFLGAAMFGATLLLTSEAHISKTDGVLVFLTTLARGPSRMVVAPLQSAPTGQWAWVLGPSVPTVPLVLGPRSKS